jgi:DNA replication protein
MTDFEGFPARMQFTPIPNLVFSSLLPKMTSPGEIKVLLYIFELIYLKKGNLRFVSRNELINQITAGNDKDLSPESITGALKALTEKGIVLHLLAEGTESPEDLYFINTEANRLAVSKIQTNEIELPRLKYVKAVEASSLEAPDIFTLYEQNIGMLTPLIADELKEAEKQYPENWIKEAIKLGVSSNKRNWRYIARILEHWSTEGKDDGTYRGNNKKNADPDKYFRGKYGHIVRR